mmetsp:Transcript_29722/g.96855  ORF Transcript_29722/g.96855 Transcript_29722/m.96855 type:complete len:178 (+) Transcript_29722:771-1304(+)
MPETILCSRGTEASLEALVQRIASASSRAATTNDNAAVAIDQLRQSSGSVLTSAGLDDQLARLRWKKAAERMTARPQLNWGGMRLDILNAIDHLRAESLLEPETPRDACQPVQKLVWDAADKAAAREALRRLGFTVIAASRFAQLGRKQALRRKLKSAANTVRFINRAKQSKALWRI